MSYYQWYEMTHAAMSPWRAAADATRFYFRNPLNPMAMTPMGKSISAACDLFERTTRRYGKPEFGLHQTTINGTSVPVHERIVWQRPFCNLLHFERVVPDNHKPDPKVLLVAPMSGHYSTLLRGTVETLLPQHDVYIADWIDARLVPTSEGRFDLDDYIDYIISMMHALGGDVHVVAVCQPSVPVLAAIARMEEDEDPNVPHTMTLMGGPIDTRCNPTAVNQVAEDRGTDWFANNVVMTVPFPHAGFMRRVYPGFLQLSGFMSMNIDRHMDAHRDYFQHLIEGDGDSAEKHRDFYDEYLAVMDLTEEFYLDTVDKIFVRHLLPKGELTHYEKPVRPEMIKRVALMTVEGEKDDITGMGQTRAAHDLCSGLSDDKKLHYMQAGVGHYGVFNGSRFRAEIAPRMAGFFRSHEKTEAIKTGPAKRTRKPATSKPATKPARKRPAKAKP